MSEMADFLFDILGGGRTKPEHVKNMNISHIYFVMGWVQNRLPKVSSFTKRWTGGVVCEGTSIISSRMLVTCSKPNIGFQFHEGKEKGMGGGKG